MKKCLIPIFTFLISAPSFAFDPAEMSKVFALNCEEALNYQIKPYKIEKDTLEQKADEAYLLSKIYLLPYLGKNQKLDFELFLSFINSSSDRPVPIPTKSEFWTSHLEFISSLENDYFGAPAEPNSDFVSFVVKEFPKCRYPFKHFKEPQVRDFMKKGFFIVRIAIPFLILDEMNERMTSQLRKSIDFKDSIFRERFISNWIARMEKTLTEKKSEAEKALHRIKMRIMANKLATYEAELTHLIPGMTKKPVSNPLTEIEKEIIEKKIEILRIQAKQLSQAIGVQENLEGKNPGNELELTEEQISNKISKLGKMHTKLLNLKTMASDLSEHRWKQTTQWFEIDAWDEFTVKTSKDEFPKKRKAFKTALYDHRKALEAEAKTYLENASSIVLSLHRLSRKNWRALGFDEPLVKQEDIKKYGESVLRMETEFHRILQAQALASQFQLILFDNPIIDGNDVEWWNEFKASQMVLRQLMGFVSPYHENLIMNRLLGKGIDTSAEKILVERPAKEARFKVYLGTKATKGKERLDPSPNKLDQLVDALSTNGVDHFKRLGGKVEVKGRLIFKMFGEEPQKGAKYFHLHLTKNPISIAWIKLVEAEEPESAIGPNSDVKMKALDFGTNRKDEKTAANSEASATGVAGRKSAVNNPPSFVIHTITFDHQY